MTSKWPNFFIIGVRKGGTTSIYNYLKQMKHVYMSPIKTPGYFFPEENRTVSTESYLSLFKNANNEKIRGEATLYYENPKCAEVIYNSVPDAKLLISLRDPIERAFSDYLGAVRKGNLPSSFKKSFNQFMNKENNDTTKRFNNLIKSGFYYESITTFSDVFGKEQLKIILFEELITNTRKTMKDVLQFLEIDEDPPENINQVYNPYREPLGSLGSSLVENKILNRVGKTLLPGSRAQTALRFLLNKNRKKPKLTMDIRNELVKIYDDDVKKVKKLLGRPLPWSL